MILNNAIADLWRFAFSYLPNAKRVWIINNRIAQITDEIFPNTTFELVSLKNNRIEHIEKEAFKYMKNLKYLDLSYNYLTNFDTNLIIEKSIIFKVLLLDNNLLDQIDITPFTNLEVLNASYNNLQTIDIQFKTQGIRLLDLSNNQITQIQKNAFSEDNDLNYLYLHNNYLQFLQSEILKNLSNLKEITISNNNWQCNCFEDITKWMKQNGVEEQCSIEEFCDIKEKCQYVELKNKTKDLMENTCKVLDWRKSSSYDEFDVEKIFIKNSKYSMIKNYITFKDLM